MIRVLHLLGSDRDAQASCGARILAGDSRDAIRSDTKQIGRGGDYRSVLDAAVSLRYRKGAADVVHAWDAQALLAAAGCGKPVVFSPSALTTRTLRQVALATRFRSIDVACATNAERDALIARGFEPGRCQVYWPAVSVEPSRPEHRQQVRQRLGIAPEDYVLLAPGESSYAAEHRLAVHVASILHVLDPRFRILLLGRGPQARGAVELGRRLKQPRVAISAELTLGESIGFEELIAAADVALATAKQFASVMPWAMCLAAGMPIVAADSRLTREVFGSEAASIVEAPGPRTLANRVLWLSENLDKARELGQAASNRASRLFGRERFIDEYHALYARVCRCETIGVPQSQRASELSRMTVTGPSLTR